MTRPLAARFSSVVLLGTALTGCAPAPAPPLPPGSFAFGVFGDGPYYLWEQGRFDRVLEDVRQSDVEWLLHIGDILWAPCSDEAFAERYRDFQQLGRPVIYTPGDNEWTDCHGDREGPFDPLERLAALRRVFFAEPERSLGDPHMPLSSQATSAAFPDFPENALWVRGGFVFATVHVVGSGNGMEPFPGRTTAHDLEVERRTTAAIAWLDEAFATAVETRAFGVVVALHGDLGLGMEDGPAPGHVAFVARLRALVAAFPGSVLLIHGDSHELRVDQPLLGPDGNAYPGFTRLETFGSPDIGWVRVVIDTVAGRITGFEPRRLRGWW